MSTTPWPITTPTGEAEKAVAYLVLCAGQAAHRYAHAEETRWREIGGVGLCANGACFVQAAEQELEEELPLGPRDSVALLDHLRQVLPQPVDAISEEVGQLVLADGKSESLPEQEPIRLGELDRARGASEPEVEIDRHHARQREVVEGETKPAWAAVALDLGPKRHHVIRVVRIDRVVDLVLIVSQDGCIRAPDCLLLQGAHGGLASQEGAGHMLHLVEHSLASTGDRSQPYSDVGASEAMADEEEP